MIACGMPESPGFISCTSGGKRVQTLAGLGQIQEFSALRLAGMVDDSIVDGPGLRLTLFTQGCPHHCKGCHNPETHPLDGGSPYSLESILARYEDNPLLSGVTFSGGEPFLQARALALLAGQIHALGGSVITYTGYVFEELAIRAEEDSAIKALLAETDLLIDGPYVEAKRSLNLPWRGSTNQRLLDREARAALLNENDVLYRRKCQDCGVI